MSLAPTSDTLPGMDKQHGMAPTASGEGRAHQTRRRPMIHRISGVVFIVLGLMTTIPVITALL